MATRSLTAPGTPAKPAAAIRLGWGRRHPGLVACSLTLLIVAVALVNLSTGPVHITLPQIAKTLAGDGTHEQALAITQLRLPRVVLAALIGTGLAVAGAILQGVSLNPLADPGLLGITGGASLGVAGFMLAAPGGADAALGLQQTLANSTWGLPLAALTGAFAAAATVFALSRRHGEIVPSRLLLVGVSVGFGTSALLLLVSLKLSNAVYSQLLIWLAGSLSATTWSYVWALLPWIVVLVPIAISQAQTINVLNMGSAMATGLGAAVNRQRILLLSIAVGLAAACVAVSGAISFIGLMAPHIARRLVGPNHRVLLATSGLVGAALVIAADTIARNVFQSVGQVPVGIVVSVIGAPYFLFLLMRTRG